MSSSQSRSLQEMSLSDLGFSDDDWEVERIVNVLHSLSRRFTEISDHDDEFYDVAEDIRGGEELSLIALKLGVHDYAIDEFTDALSAALT